MLLEPIVAQIGSSVTPKLRRSFLTLVVCRSLGGQVETAVPAAAGIEFFAAALDVFDDVEDQDAGEALWQKYGRAQALNVANGLLSLAQLAIGRLDQAKVGSISVTRAAEAMARCGIAACAGQQFDLDWESRASVTEAEYIRMTGMKSGSLVECACCLGAILAQADETTVACLSTFGRQLGIGAQITNDARGVVPGEGGPLEKSDILRRKKTLPVIFALSRADPADRAWLNDIYSSDSPIDASTERRVTHVIEHSGAVFYSMTRAELYKQRAVLALQKARLPDSVMRSLRLALDL